MQHVQFQFKRWAMTLAAFVTLCGQCWSDKKSHVLSLVLSLPPGCDLAGNRVPSDLTIWLKDRRSEPETFLWENLLPMRMHKKSEFQQGVHHTTSYGHVGRTHCHGRPLTSYRHVGSLGHIAMEVTWRLIRGSLDVLRAGRGSKWC